MSLFIAMITWDQIMLVQLAAQFFVLVALELFSIDVFNVVIIILKFSLIKKKVSYVPRLAKVVNVLAIRQVKQGTETTGFRIGFTLHSCQYVSS